MTLPVQGRPARLLVVYKRTTVEQMRETPGDERLQQLLQEGHQETEELVAAHEQHVGTVAEARDTLSRMGVDADFSSQWNGDGADTYDLVVTLGGDGTLLWTSHMVASQTPLLGINSAPRASMGYFCAGDKHSLEETVSQALEGRLRRTELSRMMVEIDGRVVTQRVLNDVLFCHDCPAVTSRYLIRHREVQEDQRSSGIWIGPPAGSTAAQRSAGGEVLPLGSQQLQFVVREPYRPRGGPEPEVVQGLVEPGEALWLQSRMQQGRLFVDGHHRRFSVLFGAELRMTRSPEPLTLLGLRKDARRE